MSHRARRRGEAALFGVFLEPPKARTPVDFHRSIPYRSASSPPFGAVFVLSTPGSLRQALINRRYSRLTLNLVGESPGPDESSIIFFRSLTATDRPSLGLARHFSSSLEVRGQILSYLM